MTPERITDLSDEMRDVIAVAANETYGWSYGQRWYIYMDPIDGRVWWGSEYVGRVRGSTITLDRFPRDAVDVDLLAAPRGETTCD